MMTIWDILTLKFNPYCFIDSLKSKDRVLVESVRGKKTPDHANCDKSMKVGTNVHH